MSWIKPISIEQRISDLKDQFICIETEPLATTDLCWIKCDKHKKRKRLHLSTQVEPLDAPLAASSQSAAASLLDVQCTPSINVVASRAATDSIDNKHDEHDDLVDERGVVDGSTKCSQDRILIATKQLAVWRATHALPKNSYESTPELIVYALSKKFNAAMPDISSFMQIWDADTEEGETFRKKTTKSFRYIPSQRERCKAHQLIGADARETVSYPDDVVQLVNPFRDAYIKQHGIKKVQGGQPVMDPTVDELIYVISRTLPVDSAITQQMCDLHLDDWRNATSRWRSDIKKTVAGVKTTMYIARQAVAAESATPAQVNHVNAGLGHGNLKTNDATLPFFLSALRRDVFYLARRVEKQRVCVVCSPPTALETASSETTITSLTIEEIATSNHQRMIIMNAIAKEIKSREDVTIQWLLKVFTSCGLHPHVENSIPFCLLQWDHRRQGEKRDLVANLRGDEQLLEMKKCDTKDIFCHAARTSVQLGFDATKIYLSQARQDLKETKIKNETCQFTGHQYLPAVWQELYDKHKHLTASRVISHRHRGGTHCKLSVSHKAEQFLIDLKSGAATIMCLACDALYTQLERIRMYPQQVMSLYEEPKIRAHIGQMFIDAFDRETDGFDFKAEGLRLVTASTSGKGSKKQKTESSSSAATVIRQ